MPVNADAARQAQPRLAGDRPAGRQATKLIPREAALKVQEREPQRIVLLNVASEVPDDEDDP